MFESIQLEPLDPALLWILLLAFAIAFLLAFSVGANDVSNSFGTSVGSRVLTVTQACILATFFETAGATLLGYSVCDTFRKKMYNVELYDGKQRELMLGALACLIGSAAWNLIATAFKMPISGTHSIVGATIGFSVVLRGWDSIRWKDMLRIVASWFASPLLSGLISSLIYLTISKCIIRRLDPLRYGLKALPLFYGATIFINVASIVIDGPEVFGLNLLPWYAGLFISLVAASIAICCVAMILVPKLRREILEEIIARNVKKPPKIGPGLAAAPAAAVQSKRGSGHDNATFKPDNDVEAGRAAGKKIPPQKPKRVDSKLDSTRSAAGHEEEEEEAVGREEKTNDESNEKQQQKTDRPSVAPKPAHLRRQMAREQLEEIDLNPGSEKADEPQKQAPSQQKSVTIKDNGKQMQIVDIPAPFPSNNNGGNHLPSFGGERYEVARLFSSLQIMTACFASFAHGTNDVSNAVAPLIPIWNIYSDGFEDTANHTQIWILAFGSIGICTGLWAWGRAVMGTISDGITKITPSKGFSIELGAAISVLLATKFGLPISTTHCKVGSLVVVGLVSSKFLHQDRLLANGMEMAASNGNSSTTKTDEKDGNGDDESVDWKMFGGIALTWIVTVPAAGLASALVMYILKWLVM